MAFIQHNSGLHQSVVELGFDQVKYFENSITGTATGFTISPPARRITLINRSTTDPVFLRVNDSPATASVSFVPGDDVKIGPGCTFTMDFDVLNEVSFITAGATVAIEGVLGWKGSIGC